MNECDFRLEATYRREKVNQQFANLGFILLRTWDCGATKAREWPQFIHGPQRRYSYCKVIWLELYLSIFKFMPHLSQPWPKMRSTCAIASPCIEQKNSSYLCAPGLQKTSRCVCEKRNIRSSFRGRGHRTRLELAAT